MRKETPTPKFSKNHVMHIFGLNVILLCLVVFFSANSRLRFLSYGFSYVFGLAGLYSVLIPLFLWGGYHLIRGSRRLPLRFLFAWICLFLGLFLLFGGLSYPKETSGVADTSYFLSSLDVHQNSHDLSIWYDMRLGSGILGAMSVYRFFNIANGLIAYLGASILLLAAFILVFFPLLKALWRKIFASIAIAKSRRKERKAQKEEEDEPYEEPIPIKDNPDAITFKPPLTEPTFIPKEEVAPKKEKEENPFIRAKKTPLPSLDSLRQRSSSPYAENGFAPIISAPYSNGPLMTSGLVEARFDPDSHGFGANSPEPSPAPEPSPITPSYPSPEPVVPPYPTPEPAIPPFSTPEPPSIPPQPKEEEAPEESFAPSFLQEPPVEKEKEIEPEPFVMPAPVLSEPVPPSFAPATPGPVPGPTPVAPMPVEEPVPAPVQETPKEKTPLDLEPDAKPLPPYTLPPIELLEDSVDDGSDELMKADVQRKIDIIDKTYRDLRVGAHVSDYVIGPQVTRFAIQADDDVSVSSLGKVVADIEVRLNGLPTRFNERVYGMSTSALEVTNEKRRTVSMRELMRGMPENTEKNRMVIPFGEDIGGKVRSANFIELPHLLVAGTTRSGKTVFIHTILLALLMRNRPEELKLVLVDPKRVEMSKYRDLPHLLCPVIKEPKEAVVALKKLCDEMERRLTVFETAGVQDIQEYNSDYCEYAHKRKMAYIVAVIDEFNDLVMAAKDVSSYVLKLGQKARAAGIHLIVATQRPDAKVIDGTLKSNLPARVALTVATATDSMTILGFKGAEELSGYGDMLIDCIQISRGEFLRAQSAFATSRDMRAVTEYIRSQQQPDYDPAFLNLKDEEEENQTPQMNGSMNVVGNDAPPSEETLSAMKAAGVEEKYQMIKKEVMSREFTSISQIQRDYGVGFPRAGKIYARLMKEGIISNDVPNGSKGAKVIVHNVDALPEESNPGSLSQSETSYSGEEE